MVISNKLLCFACKITTFCQNKERKRYILFYYSGITYSLTPYNAS